MRASLIPTLCLFCTSASAASFQWVITHDGSGNLQGSGPTTGVATHSQTVTGTNTGGSLFGQATSGTLRASSSGFSNSSFGSGFQTFQGSATAITYGYVIFTCGSCGSTTVATSLNINLDGNMSYTNTDALQLPRASLYVEFRFDAVQDASYWDIGAVESANGIFTGMGTPGQTSAVIPIGSTFTSGTHTVPVNTPVLIQLQLDTQVYTWATSGNSNTATSDFQHTMSFALNGPVFNLPTGFTANSEDFGIVENRFTVPEPRVTALAGACLVLMLIRRRQFLQR